MRSILAFTTALVLSLASPVTTAANPVVNIETNQGSIQLELFPERAPETVENFLAYVDAGFYDGTIFHRVIKNFMIQGGGLDADLQKKTTRAPIQNEANNGLKNDRGTVAMARTGNPHSATAQFFINQADNDFLNHRDETERGWGYTVFGRVTEGMDVVDKIAGMETGNKGPYRDVPETTVLIEQVTLMTVGDGSNGESNAES